MREVPVNSLSTILVSCTSDFNIQDMFVFYYVGPNSSVGIATRYLLGGPGIEPQWGARFSAPVQNGPGAHTASCTMGTVSFPGVKLPGCGVDHPPLLTPRLKKE